MAKLIPGIEYREHCIKQGRKGIKPLTRKQQKALRQHKQAMAKVATNESGCWTEQTDAGRQSSV